MLSPQKKFTEVIERRVDVEKVSSERGLVTALDLKGGGRSERVEEPNQIVPALQRARKVTDDGHAALLEFITSREISYSRMK